MQRIEDLEFELKTKDRNLIQHEKAITELRLRLPASRERDEVFNNAVVCTSKGRPG